MYDVVVIGGGAAGMFSAAIAAKRLKRVLLVEKNQRPGRKLRITGKGRCNVTNDCTGSEVLQNIPRNGRFLYSAIQTYPPSRVMDFFENHGCPLKTERGNRVFPVSDQAKSVLDCSKISNFVITALAILALCIFKLTIFSTKVLRNTAIVYRLDKENNIKGIANKKTFKRPILFLFDSKNT